MRPGLRLITGALCLCQMTLTVAVTRKYFIAANEIEWEYAPGGKNLARPSHQGEADEFLKPSSERIGGKYLKVTYFAYTDATFQRQIAKPASLGLLGPTIRGEIGDVIEVVYFNNASRIYSMHPHGVFYNKDSEGAIYLDGSSGRSKEDDVVFPGQKVNFTWIVGEEDAPGPGDPDCIPWVYHSHVRTARDTSAGVLGTMVTCRKGMLDANNERVDVDHEYPLLLKIFDENLSWYLDDNIARFCLDPATCAGLKEDDDFVNSNHMRAINGYMFGHLPDLKACVGQRVQFLLIGMGNEFDVHSLYFHGLNLKYQHTRGDTVSVYTATFVAAETRPTSEGTWRLSDVVDGNTKGGMTAFFTTTANCSANTTAPEQMVSGETRWYYLAAEKVQWNYGPGGRDHFSGLPLDHLNNPSAPYFGNSSNRIGGTYTKARFVQYTDASYGNQTEPVPEESHLGIMGPVIRAEPGDIVQVMLRNDVEFPVSFLPHGLVSKDVHGYNGSVVMTNMTQNFTFRVPHDLLDNVTDHCRNFLYTSAADPELDHHAGLVGQILICRPGYHALPVSSKPKEIFLLLAGFDENKSFYLDENINDQLPQAVPDSLKADEDFMLTNVMYSINGYSFASTDLLRMCQDETIMWYVAALGSELDVHPLAFDGNTFRHLGTNRDVISLVSGTTATLRMTPDNAGNWLVMSNSNLARDGGAYTLYTVEPCNGTSRQRPPLRGKDRQYFVAVEEVDWDYTPLKRELIDGVSLDDPRSEGNIFIKSDEDFIGNVYRKAVFRQYEDEQFHSLKKRTFKDEHLDIIGPILRAEVGDTITVYLRNKASLPFSMHPHGLRYSKANNGRPYGGGHSVVPGQQYVYRWEVPERSGPGPQDPNCIPWMYYSALNPTKDVNSGLMGAIIICRPGTLNKDDQRTDFDRELFVFMSVFDENKSWYLDKNVDLFAPHRKGTDFHSDPDFDESNKMHAVNGRLYGNNPGFVVEYHQAVVWYFLALGTEIDVHTIHTHGNTFLHTSAGHRDDVLVMFPGMAEAVSMQAVNPGTWLLHCHVLDHIAAGMETTYTVLQPGEMLPMENSTSFNNSPGENSTSFNKGNQPGAWAGLLPVLACVSCLQWMYPWLMESC